MQTVKRVCRPIYTIRCLKFKPYNGNWL